MANVPPEIPRLGELINPLSRHEMLVEANRCLYCYDAPCTKACPTEIDVPKFIRQLATENTAGAASTIFESNLLGATCARVCPVAQLCEGACVLNEAHRPISIGRLQRFAMDEAYRAHQLPSASPLKTGFRVAVVGSGPAGLSCAGQLARRGHDVTIFEASEYPGGLSTSGIIALREPLDVSLAEVELVQSLGVTLKLKSPVTDLATLRQEFDAVFLALGFGSTPRLNIPGEDLVTDGLDYIRASKLRPNSLPAAKRVAVIGGGNTAIDCATVAKRNGAEKVSVLVRRSERDMPAYPEEVAFAKSEGIDFSFSTVITSVHPGIRLEGQKAGHPFAQDVDLVVRATGQTILATYDAWGLAVREKHLVVNSELETNLSGVFAGGDCIRVDEPASTVASVQDGKVAAAAIHRRSLDLRPSRNMACQS